MKKSIFLLIALTTGCLAFAQKGEIIYTDFEPDSVAQFIWLEGATQPRIYLDIDHDGENDCFFYFEEGYHFMVDIVLRSTDNSWLFRPQYQIYHGDQSWPITDTISIGDTIQGVPEPWLTAYRWRYNRNQLHPTYQQVCPVPNSHYYISFKRQVEGGVCYGWLDTYVYLSESPAINGTFDPQDASITVRRMAYCTIPNYPLRVGQTDFSWWDSLNEVPSNGFVSIQPNPTSGVFTVAGLNLEQVEVFNAFGQLVATTSEKGELITLDLCGQPSGIYFVNVTDSEGRKCVKKVVKH